MAPKTSQQYEDIRSKSREKIMEAAIELFAVEGYHSASISKIAKKAGVSKGLMYNYFKSKTDLIDEIMLNSFKEVEEEFGNILAMTNPYQKLVRLITWSFDLAKKDIRRWQLLTAVMTQLEVVDHLRKGLMANFEIYITILENIFKEIGVPMPRAEAYRLYAMLDGVMLHYMFISPENYPIDTVETQILKDYEKYKKD